jgi:hypothetical protein
VVSDGITARIGFLTANKECFMPWRTIKNENDKPLLEYEAGKGSEWFSTQDQDVQRIVQLIDRYGVGLEQEVLLF